MFTPGLKPVSQILLPMVSFLPPGLPSRTIAWTVSCELFGFCFYLFFRMCHARD